MHRTLAMRGRDMLTTDGVFRGGQPAVMPAPLTRPPFT